MKKIKLISLFAGIGAFEEAAKRIYDDVEVVAAAEIDKYARESYLANHTIDEEHFYKDVKLLDGKKYKGKYDCLCFGFPCQDYSIAGKRAGLDGQRGTLFYEAARILKDSSPDMFIAENVKGLLSSNGGKDFKVIIEILRDELGYYCHYEVLNTKDYGVPQNRERIFLVGFKDHEHYYNFSFAPKQKLTTRLKDLLESDVDEKYYLNDRTFDILNDTNKGCVAKLTDTKFESAQRIFGTDGVSPTLITQQGGDQEPKILIPSATSKGYEEATEGDSINLTRPNSTTRRGRVGKQVAQTLDCACNQAVVEENREPKIYQTGRGYNKGGEKEICPTITINSWQDNNHLIQDYRIRKLTPRECFRLQDFPDTFKQVVSNSQAYKQAGNSISVNVMEMIFNQIEKSRHGNTVEGSLF